MSIEVGNRIKNIRLSLGLTMEEFGELFDEPAVEELRKYEDDIYATNRFINTEFRDYDFCIPETDGDIEVHHDRFW